MEVKDVPTIPVTGAALRQSPAENTGKQRAPTGSEPDDGISVDSSVDPKSERLWNIRKAASDAVSVINVAADATDEIEKLARSISGIVEQASRPDVPEKNLPVLETEANQLVQAIKVRIQSSITSSGNPLTGDPIRVEVEEELGQALDIVLPDDAKDSFGLGQIDFSRRQAIINTQVAVEQARRNIESLKAAVDRSKERIAETASKIDVILQNREAANPSLRDLDAALDTVGDLSFGIAKDPKRALDSIRAFDNGATELLK